MIVVNDEALHAALETYTAGAKYGGPFSEIMRACIAAAAEHLTDAGQPLTSDDHDGSYPQGRYAAGRRAGVRYVTEMYANGRMSTANDRAAAFARGFREGLADQGGGPRSEIAGWELPSWVGRTRNVLIRNASPTRPPDIVILDGEPVPPPVEAVIENVASPSDYELWRDALQLALQSTAAAGGGGVDPRTIARVARFWRDALLDVDPADPYDGKPEDD